MIRPVFLLSLLLFFPACYVSGMSSSYRGPEARPDEVNEYYDCGDSYNAVSSEMLFEAEDVNLERIVLNSESGQIKMDYYYGPEVNDDLIFVFPILGGRNKYSSYFAEYFAKRGYDSVVVHRDKEFKKPENVTRLEDIFRTNVIRDRIAIDYFETVRGKKDFGSFGISRGAINAAVVAGVDPRLKYNVFAMGGSDVVDVFRSAPGSGMKHYREKACEYAGVSEEELYQLLEKQIKSDPKNFAKYIDARNTLMILAVFDDVVKFHNGMKLRSEIGNPRTVFIPAGHLTSALFTQVYPVLMPDERFCLFPLDYIESEAVAFYDERFHDEYFSFRKLALRAMQLPINFIGTLFPEDDLEF